MIFLVFTMVISHSSSTLPAAPEASITDIPAEMNALFISLANEEVHEWTCSIPKLTVGVMSSSCAGIVNNMMVFNFNDRNLAYIIIYMYRNE